MKETHNSQYVLSVQKLDIVIAENKKCKQLKTNQQQNRGFFFFWGGGGVGVETASGPQLVILIQRITMLPTGVPDYCN